MDLKEFDALTKAQEEGIEVDITHPKTHERIGITFRVAGVDSTRMRKARRAVTEARLKSGKLTGISAEQLEQEGLDYIVAACMSWKWDPAVPAVDGKPAIPATTLDGVVPEFNEKNVRALLTRFPFMKEQLDLVAGSRAGFMEA